MRASAVRTAIIDAVLATARDYQARADDAFAVLRTPQEPESVRSRTVMVKLLSGPTKSDVNTCDLFDVTYQLALFYPAGPDSEDRVAADLEQLYRPLWNLHRTYADMESSEPGPPSLDEGNGMLVARIDVAISYRLDASLLT